MPKVDNLLIREAQLLTTGASIHDTNELVAMYRGAADHDVSFIHFEEALKQHVAKLRAHRWRSSPCSPIG